MNSHEWAAVTPSVIGRYRQLFDRRASANRIVASLAKIVGAPLTDVSEEVADNGTVPENVALVDRILLERVRGLVIGCHMCSPFAEIPLFVVLDQLRDATTARTQYVFEQAATCSRCGRLMTENTLIDMRADL